MKAIYFDINHWIKLSQVLHGKISNETLSNLASRLSDGVRSGEFILPLLDTHFMEFVRHGNLGARERLASLFIDLGQGWVITNQDARLTSELDVAAAELARSKPKLSELRPFGRGIIEAFGRRHALALLLGRPVEYIAQLEVLLDSPEGWVSHLRYPDEEGRRKATDEGRTRSARWASERESARLRVRDASYDMQWCAYAGTTMYSAQAAVETALARYGFSMQHLIDHGPEVAIPFTKDIPYFNVDISLTAMSERQWHRPIQPNDLFDKASLAAAIPYCDIVLTEAFWADLAKRAGLHTKYGTHLLGSLESLWELLSE